MQEGVHVEVAEGDLCTGRIAADGGVGVGKNSMFVGEDGFQEVILEVSAGEGLSVLAFHGEVALVVGIRAVEG